MDTSACFFKEADEAGIEDVKAIELLEMLAAQVPHLHKDKAAVTVAVYIREALKRVEGDVALLEMLIDIVSPKPPRKGTTEADFWADKPRLANRS